MSSSQSENVEEISMVSNQQKTEVKVTVTEPDKEGTEKDLVCLCCPCLPSLHLLSVSLHPLQSSISLNLGLSHHARTLLPKPTLSFPVSSGSSFFPHGLSFLSVVFTPFTRTNLPF